MTKACGHLTLFYNSSKSAFFFLAETVELELQRTLIFHKNQSKKASE